MFSHVRAALLAGASIVSAASGESADSVLAGWIRQAQHHHPSAMAANEVVAAGASHKIGAGAWMAPEARLESRSDGTAELSLSQMFPAPGAISARRREREAAVRMAREDSSGTALRIAVSVGESAWMEWMAWRRHDILAGQESVLVALHGSAQRLQSQGMLPTSEVWLARARAEEARSETERALAEARAATAMREVWTGPGQEVLRPGDPAPPDWEDSVLVGALPERPDLRAVAEEAGMHEAMAGGMRSENRPNLMLGGMVMRMADGMPGWGIMAGTSLPFVPWARGMAASGARAEEARSREAFARREAMERMARSELSGASARARAAWSARERALSVLAGRDEALEDARRRYGQGVEMLRMALSMEEMARMARLDEAMRRSEYEIERIRTWAASGRIAPTRGGGR